MENVTDNELIARIRRSDEEAFYAFCSRHWKSLYVRLLMEMGSKEEAFECVKDSFVDFWNRRRQLPDMTTPVEQYVIAVGTDVQQKSNIGWNLIHLLAEAASYLKKLRGSLGVLLSDKHLRYK